MVDEHGQAGPVILQTGQGLAGGRVQVGLL